MIKLTGTWTAVMDIYSPNYSIILLVTHEEYIIDYWNTASYSTPSSGSMLPQWGVKKSLVEPAGEKIKLLRFVAVARAEAGRRFHRSVPRNKSGCLITLKHRLDMLAVGMDQMQKLLAAVRVANSPLWKGLLVAHHQNSMKVEMYNRSTAQQQYWICFRMFFRLVLRLPWQN